MCLEIETLDRQPQIDFRDRMCSLYLLRLRLFGDCLKCYQTRIGNLRGLTVAMASKVMVYKIVHL
jgi:hypothetical protein